MFSTLPESEIRGICIEKLESLEFWLRRLIDELLSETYGDYFSHVRYDGSNLISKSKILKDIEARIANDPERYPKKIDAASLSNAIEIICNPYLFKQHFKRPLKTAFPTGREMALTIFRRLLDPRHRLTHEYPLLPRQAEQVFCYTGDIIDSLKEYYSNKSTDNDCKVPQIVKVVDPLGRILTRNACFYYPNGAIGLSYDDKPEYDLRPGDILTLSVELDESYPANEYSVSWHISKGEEIGIGTTLQMKIETKHVSSSLMILCKVVSDKSWHKIRSSYDDLLGIRLKVLPST